MLVKKEKVSGSQDRFGFEEPKFRSKSSFTYWSLAFLFCASISIFSVLYLYGPILNAAIGLVDDHELYKFLNNNPGMSVANVPHILATQTEVGDWGNSQRYRPIYYMLRLLELSAYGLDSRMWFTTRLVIVGLASTSISFMLLLLGEGRMRASSRWRRGILFVSAGLAALALVCLPAWTGIVLRLGPSEIYVALGLATLAAGVSAGILARNNKITWVFACIGFIIAMGAKEDLLVLGLPLLVVAFVMRRTFGNSWVVWTLIVATEIFCVWISTGVLIAGLSHEGDVYGQQRSFAGFVSVITGNSFVFVALLALLAHSNFGVHNEASNSATNWLERILSKNRYFWIALGLIYLSLCEAYFYQTAYTSVEWVTQENSRYGLMSQMIYIADLWLILIWAVTKISSNSSGIFVSLSVAALFITSTAGVSVQKAVQTYRPMSKEITRATNAQFERLGALANRLIKSGEGVVFVAQDPWDYELIYGATEELRYLAGIKNVQLFMEIKSSQFMDPFIVKLVKELESKSKFGDETGGWYIEPLSKDGQEDNSVCVSFRRAYVSIPNVCSSAALISSNK